MILDATGIGDPIYDDLSMVLTDIEPFKLTTVNKPLLIQRLMGVIEQRQVSWPAAVISRATGTCWEVVRRVPPPGDAVERESIDCADRGNAADAPVSRPIHAARNATPRSIAPRRRREISFACDLPAVEAYYGGNCG